MAQTICKPFSLFLYIKLRPVETAKEASHIQYKLWENHDLTVQAVITYVYLCVQWYAASISYFLKPWTEM
jgi:hypothetical protein